MQYTVTVYNSLNGQRGDLATDSNGAELAWSNDKAVCGNNCQAAVIAPGTILMVENPHSRPQTVPSLYGLHNLVTIS